ncbi:MAG: class B sortase [Acutalibacteraceae bacterium]|nr:class B sortase [Acutalibacteraceae bacterium]
MKKIIKFIDKSINGIISVFIVLLLLYSFWGVYDIISVYSTAHSGSFSGLLSQEKTLTEYMNINPDVKALLTVENTRIKYPVLQGEDNLEYINKTFEGEDSLSGSIFIDFMNSPDFTDFYTLFYGHRMEGSAMFGEIGNFTEEAYFNNHPYGRLETPTGTYKIHFFACSRTLTNNENIFNVSVANLNSDVTLAEIKKTAVQSRNIKVRENDRIVALSTCENATTSGRIILFGVLKGE